MNQQLIKYSIQQIPGPPLDETISKKKPNLAPLANKPSIIEILNGIFPPTYYEENGQWNKKNISNQELSRDQLKTLQMKLQKKLHERQASKFGICPIRQDVHNQLMDELIRQCVINCPQRGLLLMRVRDNLKLTFAAYQTLYQGSYIFGNRKAHVSQLGIPELQKKLQDIKKKIIGLTNKKILLQNNLQSTQKRFRQINNVEDKRRQEQLQYLNQQTTRFSNFLANCK